MTNDLTVARGHMTLVITTGATLCEHKRVHTRYRHESTTIGDIHYIDDVCEDCGMVNPFSNWTSA